MTPQPFLLGKEEGPAIWFLGTLTLVKASAATTGGALGVAEQLLPAGFESPYHLHHNEDESFYILEGEATFVCDGKKLRAGPGDFLFGPRNVPHGFRIEGSSPARMLIFSTPPGFEKFAEEAGEPAAERSLPPPAAPDLAALIAIASKYKIDILGPLPD